MSLFDLLDRATIRSYAARCCTEVYLVGSRLYSLIRSCSQTKKNIVAATPKTTPEVQILKNISHGQSQKFIIYPFVIHIDFQFARHKF